jgi:flavin-dependent dehydrogenase
MRARFAHRTLIGFISLVVEERQMSEFDAIVVGARVAGSPTAMLLAKRGYRVLLVDRATFPSDTISSHLIHAPGMAALERWGLGEAIRSSGCPPVRSYRFDLGEFAIVGSPRGLPEASVAHAPRRTVLDKILVDAAALAGAEVRESFQVEALVTEEGVVRGIRGRSPSGGRVVERAPVVIGADGVNSIVARSVGAVRYREVPALEALYLAYWEGFPHDNEFALYSRGRRGIGTIPTNDDLTVIVATWSTDEFEANRRDLLGNYLRSFETDATLLERVAAARRVSRPVGMLMHNFYRQSFGPGWALVGDAGYHKDAVTAQGISDAFRDADALATALDDVFGCRRTWDDALRSYQQARDDSTGAMFELTCQLASTEPPDDQTAGLFGMFASSPAASDDFASVLAGTMPVRDFFDERNLARYQALPGAAA